ncbi:hypothetical protein N7535_005772 [Penicillium sp. DV-2018c]|nr:hypothetical protein N7461_009347 [Penicillium sp. DV-2018c]KAJ5572112.1 hypothetical protein N7535_005772 [Penicillium sp. DV-2018c]
MHLSSFMSKLWGDFTYLLLRAWPYAYPGYFGLCTGFPNEVSELQAILPFHDETKKTEIPQQLRDLLCLMLVPDPKTRPSVSSVLASKECLKTTWACNLINLDCRP